MSAGGNQEQSAAEGTSRSVLTVARTAQNLSVADVARQLKLTERQVQALEEGAFERLPGPVFVRGFARNYARLLKLEPERVLASLNLDPAPQAERIEMQRSAEIPFPSRAVRRWPKYAVAAVLVFAGLAAYEFYHEESPSRGTGQAPAPSAERAVAPRPVSDATPVSANVTASVTQEATSLSQSAEDTAGATQQTAPASSPAVGAAPAAEQGELHFVFETESWVEVRDGDGRIMLTRLNAKGTEQRIRGKPPFRLIVGNARGVRLTYNERPVDLERHIKISVARLTVE